MNVRGIELLEEFWTRHRDPEKALRAWWNIVAAAHWSDFVKCRQNFRSADQVKLPAGVVTVFNIKGNHYRLIAAVNYPLELVVVRIILTHEQYSENRWKGRI
ncbi:MAG TPA: type II toxin-antitoxin system HigB family toxin [Phycisphaerae bacterium]|nr:type II toxin-antitoxin system HigB family toxin [Phycisphaerae bacterium]